MTKKSILMILIVIVVVFASTVSGTVNQGIVQNGDHDSATQIVGDAFIKHATITNQITNNNNGGESISVMFPASAPSPSYLDVGTVDYTRLIYPDQVILIPATQNQTFMVRAGTPVSLYTINGTDRYKVKGSQSIPVYDNIYDRLDHGETSWVDWIPYYTTKETIVNTGGDYLVVDNRNIFTSYNLIEVLTQ